MQSPTLAVLLNVKDKSLPQRYTNFILIMPVYAVHFGNIFKP